MAAEIEQGVDSSSVLTLQEQMNLNMKVSEADREWFVDPFVNNQGKIIAYFCDDDSFENRGVYIKSRCDIICINRFL